VVIDNPVIPSIETPVLEQDLQTALQSTDKTRIANPSAWRFNPSWYQFFNLEIQKLSALLNQGASVAGIQGPYSASTNITADLYGVADTRPSTWGFTDVADNNIVFSPPAGMRTRILRVYGNVYVMPKVVDPIAGPFPNVHGFTGMLWGLITTAPGGSSRANPVADSCMAFYQAAMGALDPVGFDFDFGIGEGVAPAHPTMGLLEPDNILTSRLASFLNTLGTAIHCETEFVVIYQFEPAA
jgi:hypothetical protein